MFLSLEAHSDPGTVIDMLDKLQYWDLGSRSTDCAHKAGLQIAAIFEKSRMGGN